ncbi:MAG: DUF1016 family protein [Bacteroidales bacterium]|nr:DUF1016 family protein [Bacteroidales bacterium]
MKNILNIGNQHQFNFDILVNRIQQTDHILQQEIYVAINKAVTCRAWLTGFYIIEYEQNGKDRAKYGEHLLQKLSKKLGKKSFGLSSLKNYRLFYLYYPELKNVIIRYLTKDFEDKYSLNLTTSIEKSQSVIDQSEETYDNIVICDNNEAIKINPYILFTRLSYTHIIQLLHLDNDLQRTFYAAESIRGTWSVRELKRQIDTNYYVRSGWSEKPQLLADNIKKRNKSQEIEFDIKNPYCFEFLGLSSKDVIIESDLESAIVSNLKNFILELGMGFCLEEEQKRLLIDDRYYKIDLVFYHRILKCHCIVELKAHRLDYSDIAQINMYIEYYRKNYMQSDDNPPIGLLLCTEYGKEMVEYMTPFISKQLFVAKYELQLPNIEKIRNFLMRENKR